MLRSVVSSHLNIWSWLTWLQCCVILCGQNKCLLSSNIWHKTLVKHSFRTKLISSPLRCTIQLSIPGKEVEFNRAKETWLQTNVSYSRHNGHWIRYINTWSLNDTGIMTLGDKCNGIMGSIDWCVSCLHFAIIHVGKLVHRNGQKTRHIFPEGSVFQNGKVVSGEPGRKHPQLLNRSYPTAVSLWKRRTPPKHPQAAWKKTLGPKCVYFSSTYMHTECK